MCYNSFMEKDREILVLGGGCFWCTEAVFKMLKGVVSVESGYAGGDAGAEGPGRSEGQVPTYEEVCSGKTGYAEVIKIEYEAA